ncbi:MAG: TIGR03663 family protein [Candidatus Aminicenantes bacterium]|nr:TIGR03663 family protein [Candidatus Aminicenantes bacterium]
MTTRRYTGLVLAVFLAALAVRLFRLDLRPMHHDEANQAVKFGELLENGRYAYDKTEHHGPTLYYFSLPAARAAGARTLADLSESDLRRLPAVLGAAVVLLFALLASGLSREAVVFAGLFAAVSPVMVYYSRFYIQETLLVFFLAGLLGFGWQWAKTRSVGAAAAAGLCAGLMAATKETAVIVFAVAAAALVLIYFFSGENRVKFPVRVHYLGLLAFVVAAGAVIFFFYSSFLKNPDGPHDWLASFATYFGRAGGEGQAAVHRYPWYYYLKLVGFNHPAAGPLWSEAFILALAVAGAIAAFTTVRGRDGDPTLQRFLVFFTGLAAVVYSVIPYKTPWNVLPFYLGIIMLAGLGASLIWRASRFIVFKILALLILVPGLANLGSQTYQANFVFPADPKNPYVYAQTVPDYQRLIRRVEDVARVAPEGRNLLIKVVAPADETWPLPWSLRRFTRVGFWTDAASAGMVEGAPLIIASAGMAEKLEPSLSRGYQVEHYGLRPEVVLTLAVRRDLWDKLMAGVIAERERP